MMAIEREEACFLIQSMVISHSYNVSDETKKHQRTIAARLEEIWPGILAENYGGILLK